MRSSRAVSGTENRDREGPSFLALLGPTASGKTALSLALAKRLEVEIISMDSRQVYRGMDIGTAKPTADELAQVPHHLIDLLDPDQGFSLAEYQERAYVAIDGVLVSSGHLLSVHQVKRLLEKQAGS